jgi:2-phospho-L-lactate guanylyltransferase
MTVTVVPFRAGGKTRLPETLRAVLALAMLADVLAAAAAVGAVRVVTDDEAARVLAAEQGAEVVGDPGGGQGPAVLAGLAGLPGPALVVNADLPCVDDAVLRALLAAAPAHVAARDGTTNALALVDPEAFVPRFGPGSASRHAADGLTPVVLPALVDDVDTLADLKRLSLPEGSCTAEALRRAGGAERVA